MRSRYRPFFILLSLIFLGMGVYFFVGLKNDSFSEDLKQSSWAQDIPSVDLDIRNVAEASDLEVGDTLREFNYSSEKCFLSWRVQIHAKFRTPNLSLIYNPQNSCPLETEQFLNLNRSILKKVFRDFDRKGFYELKVSELAEDQLSTLFNPFKMKVKAKEHKGLYKFHLH